MNKNILLSKKTTLIIAVILLAFLIIGSIYDFSISKALYHENDVAMFFAGYGEYPAYLGILVGGYLLVLGHNKEKKGIAILQIIGGCIGIAFGAAMVFVNPIMYTRIPKVISIPFGICCIVLVILLTRKLCKGARREDIIRVGAAFFFTVLFEILAVNIIKQPWGRPRMRLIARDVGAYFTPWWKPGTELKDMLVAAGIAKDEFRSFPSGHTANAVLLVQAGLLPHLDGRLERKRGILVIIGVIWGAVVALSRIIMGAHFLSDTVIGMAIGLCTVLIVNKVVFKNE